MCTREPWKLGGGLPKGSEGTWTCRSTNRLAFWICKVKNKCSLTLTSKTGTVWASAKAFTTASSHVYSRAYDFTRWGVSYISADIMVCCGVVYIASICLYSVSYMVISWRTRVCAVCSASPRALSYVRAGTDRERGRSMPEGGWPSTMSLRFYTQEGTGIHCCIPLLQL